MVSNCGGFIDDIDKFDHTFFKISPREAASMDPQQRHLLEVTYEAFEDAGIDPWGLQGDCGVFVGIGMMDYSILTCDSNMMDAYSLTGTTHSVAANRLSYVFNLKGPSLTVDTACASSMTALHLACCALRNKECSVAVVGGCNNLLLPDVSVGFSALGVMSPDGQCCPFSSTAKGYVRSEGWGTLILKPLDQAVSNEDHNYAVIRASAIAASGYSSSLTKPSTSAQQDVMNEVYQRCNISPSSVDYVEAHGTGTPVGDPIEADAIGKTFCLHRTTPLKIGSVKSNFGHNECAAGVTAAIKVALMLEKQTLCPMINFESPNPNIDFENLKLEVVTQLEVLEPGTFHRVAINSFGFAGALAHAVFEQPPKQANKALHQCNWTFGGDKFGEHIIIPLSAKSKGALEDLVKEWIPFTSALDALSVVAWLSTRRRHHDTRLAVVSNSGSNFRDLLSRYLTGKSGEEKVITQTSIAKAQKVCFVFPGQGQQWAGMGRKLYSTEPVFRNAVSECNEIFKKMSGKSLIHETGVFQDKNDGNHLIDEIDISQPTILFFQVGLIELWNHWGVHPNAVVGHSLGEVAAAYACGGLTVEEAVAAIYHRSNTQRHLKGTGSMAAVRKPLKEIEETCTKYQDIHVAAVNGPGSITVAGKNEEIERFLKENPSNAKKLRVQCAFHTHHMDGIKVSFERSMAGVVTTKTRLKQVPFYSTVTGRRYDGEFGTDYWWQNIRQPVQFQSAIEGIINEEQPDVFLELGSSVTLLSSIRQITGNLRNDSGINTIPSCQRNRDDRVSLLQALGSLYVAGKSIKWENIAPKCAQWQPLPSYPWQHQSHWKESEDKKKRRLGTEDRSFKGQKGNLSLNKYPFFKDHVIQNQLIFPGAGYVEYLLEMCYKEDENPALRNINFNKTLKWPDKENEGSGIVSGTVCLGFVKEGTELHVTCNGSVHCIAEIAYQGGGLSNYLQIEEIHKNLQETISQKEFYGRLKKNGFEYGPAFQVVKQVFLGDGEALGYLEAVPDSMQRIHTTILDGCLQVAIAALGPCTSLYIPIEIASFQMEVPTVPPREDLVAHASVIDCDGTLMTGDVTLAARGGNILALVKGVRARSIRNMQTRHDIQKCLYTTTLQSMESCLNLAQLETELSEECLQEKCPGEMAVIAQAEKYIPVMTAVRDVCVRHAVKATPKFDGNGISVMEENISYEDVPKIMQDIKQALPEMETELNAIQQIGEVLPVILDNPDIERNQKPEKECWEEYLWNSFAIRVNLKASAPAIAQAIHEGFKDRSVIRVLVIGDRNAELSSYVLSSIKDKGMKQELEYTFSAPSDSILQSAQQQLKDFTFVKYKNFDVGKGADEQGFIPGSIDLVICLHSLYSVANVDVSMTLIQRLLCPRGCLLIYEVTQLNYLTELLFFSSLFFHKDNTENLCLSTNKWKDFMQRNGFVDVLSVAAARDSFPSVIAGYKYENAIVPGKLPSQDKEFTIIAKEGHTLAQMLEKYLKNSKGVQRTYEVNEILEDDKTGYHPRVVIYFHSLSKAEHLPNLLTLFQKANMISDVKSLWVLTSGDGEQRQNVEESAAVGLTRAIGNSIHKFPVFSVHIDPANSPERNALHLCNLLTAPPPDHEIVIDQNRCFVPRVLPFTLTESKEVQATQWKIGFFEMDSNAKRSVDDLHFLTAKTLPLKDDEVLVEVKAAGLNFKDVMMAMGMLDKLESGDGKEGFGLECSGLVADKGNSVTKFEIGDEVVVFGKSCLASHIKCSQEHLARKPQNLNWAESAGVGIVFTTAFYCLVERAGLREGETVLVHSACGGVGLAALQVAQMVGANVICSAGTEEKRRFLKEAIGIKYVTDSRSEQFYRDVLIWTDGKGVDVVLNSLHGELMKKSIALLAHGGRFCEIGKRGILENTQIPMQVFLENKSYLSCHVDILLREEPKKFINNFEQVSKLLMENTLQPIKTTVHPISAFKETFRMMSKGEHIGKIVFDISNEPMPICLQNSANLFKPNATYIITGGFGGIGLALSRWMCKKGARHIVLTSRRGCHNAAGRRTLAFLKSQGVTVYEFAGDLSDESFVQTMIAKLNHSSSIPPITGVFHLAGIIKEADNFLHLLPDQLQLMVGCKARGAQYLHDHTLDQPLDVFMLMSSLVTIWGNPVQPSYCAANSFLDALALHRHSLGLPALSLQLGAVRGAGFLEDKSDVTRRLADKGTSTLHIDEILSVLGKLLVSCDQPVKCALVTRWETYLRFHSLYP